jgi:Planctomycete cytochrome C/WD domain, G-beta repeat
MMRLLTTFGFYSAGFLLSITAALRADEITYQDNILPLIQANCARCHNEDKKKADLDLTSYQGALKGSGSGAVLISGNPDASKLWKAVMQTEDPAMPPNQPRLPDKDLATFKNWIMGGLLERAGGKVIAAKKSEIDLTLKPDSVGKPDGPPPMPKDLPRQVVIHTARATAITGLAASPWAPLIAVSGQKQVLLFDADSLELLGILPFTEGQPVGLSFSRSGQLLLANGGLGAKSGRVTAWDVVTGKQILDMGDDYDTVLAADIRPDQTLVALGGPSRMVKIWSTKTGELQHKIKKHTEWITAVTFSPNGQMLATADRNGGISVWDPDSAQELFTLAGHKSAVTALSWRSDSKLLASSSEDGTVKLWDGSGKKLRELEKGCDLPLRASFTSDGKRVFASDFSGHVIIWNVADGKRIGSLDANPASTQTLAAVQKTTSEAAK